MKFKNSIIIIISLFIFSCGFKVANLNNSFSITEILTEGNKSINFKIKNKIKVNSIKDDKKRIILTINTKKQKSVKEKNITNQITKYQIEVSASVKFKSYDDDINGSFIVKKTGDYNVSSKYSDTLNREKKIIDSLVEKISDEIMDNLSNYLNDL
tara:strand:- start:61 stop:525 length:465 start_codon:yes stop_codon:yes gene_type:complete